MPNNLAERSDLDESDVKSVANYCARHAVNKDAKSSVWGDVSHPSAGFTAWLLWGGDEGETWAKRYHSGGAD